MLTSGINYEVLVLFYDLLCIMSNHRSKSFDKNNIMIVKWLVVGYLLLVGGNYPGWGWPGYLKRNRSHDRMLSVDLIAIQPLVNPQSLSTWPGDSQ